MAEFVPPERIALKLSMALRDGSSKRVSATHSVPTDAVGVVTPSSVYRSGCASTVTIARDAPAGIEASGTAVVLTTRFS